jgi:hypothetical protein
MEIKLSFKIMFVSGEQAVQEIAVQADPGKPFDLQARAAMQQMLGQYATIGMLRQPEPGHFKLVCPSQIVTVECELPNILIAGPTEVSLD